MYNGGNPSKLRVLLLAPTWVAAGNLDGTSVHSDLCINCNRKFHSLDGKKDNFSKQVMLNYWQDFNGFQKDVSPSSSIMDRNIWLFH